MEQIAIAGLRIAYEWAGEGPPLVLLHGGLSDRREWRRQLDALSDEFTVVAWDAPGCGQSSDPPEPFRLILQQHFASFLGLRQARGVKPQRRSAGETRSRDQGHRPASSQLLL